MASLSVLHILRTIKEQTSISRTELQRLTGLSWGTITNTTRELLSRNLIREEGAVKTKAGRKPVRLTINPTSHMILGLDISPHVLRCIALNLAGETLAFSEEAFTFDRPAQDTLAQAAAMLQRVHGSPAAAGRQCLGIGIATQGALDTKAGLMRFAPRFPGWNNVPIRDSVADKLASLVGGKVCSTVLLEHDPDCLALAERWFGQAGPYEDVLCILLGEGIGMGILSDGEIFRGSQEMAGEFGHITLDPEGPPCGCGDRGCLEAYCGEPAVIERARAMPDKLSPYLAEIFAARTPTLGEFVGAAKEGDQAARAAFAKMGACLGLGIANVIDLFNPQVVILAGPMTAGREFFMPALEERMERHAWKHSSRKILISTMGPPAVAVGACGAVLESLFEPASVEEAVAGVE